MTFTDDAWEATASIRKAIDELPFVEGLADGSLDEERFAYYLAQDAHYLLDYARVLAAAAAKADIPDDIAFFANSAHGAIAVERQLHESHLGGMKAIRPSPTCVGYTSYLLGLAQIQGYAEVVAGVLPCFWVYTDVGGRLHERAGTAAGGLEAHPYGEWIATYADEAFAAATERAKSTVDRLAATADPATLDRMHRAFSTATTWEWMFWDAAWRLESWPV